MKSYQRKTFIIVNGEQIDTTKVEFLNIEEDISGRDLMTFVYEGKTYQSFVLIK